MTNKEFKKQFHERMLNYVGDLVGFLVGIHNSAEVKEIKNQVMRSGTSIGANYFEAEAGSSKRDFVNFLHHSLKSANETKFWLMVIADRKLNIQFESEKCEKLIDETNQIANILAASILTMKGKRNLNNDNN